MGPLELEVLDANDAFYRAFTTRDADRMASLWAEDHPVACIHQDAQSAISTTSLFGIAVTCDIESHLVT